ncbi:MAG: hypothetical protein F6K40_16940 [Okeania sp. SIO3I5]|uniref:hypothetical protein n=1 Tax=Okeania sp. SIO3I5 TaxID=2607805 RepID=UPI0013BABA2B|nr:hypothetical protein [Okeania sp. SIO3I5]NEQ37855.1 hypothetical protein [Okeania sp. SIO3I5]
MKFNYIDIDARGILASSQKPKILLEEIEFTPDKDDSYFGRCSSTNNYQLPEDEELFSNSGWSIDEKGLFLPANHADDHRLIFHQYQTFAPSTYKVSCTYKVSWLFYCGSQETNGSFDFVLNLWDNSALLHESSDIAAALALSFPDGMLRFRCRRQLKRDNFPE